MKMKFAQRLLAALLGLTVTFFACACVSEDAGILQEQSVAEIETGTLKLSEMGAEGVADEKITASEQIEGTVSIEPIEPIVPIEPKERETTLEKVLSFDIGLEGVFQYRFLFYDDPSIASIELPGDIFCGSDGKLYHYVNTSAMRRLICLDSGDYMDIRQGDLRDMLIKDKTLYIMTMDGLVYEFDVTEGLSRAVISNEYQIFDKFEELGTLVDLGDKQPIVHTNKDEFITLSKDRLLESERPYVCSDDKTDSADVYLSVGAAPQWFIQRDAVSVVDVTSERMIVREKGTTDTVSVYTAYDKKGDLLFRFAKKGFFGFEKTPCEIEYEYYDNRYTVQECALYTAVVGKTVFENVLSERVFFAPDGTVYFAAYYTDHCDVYRVNAGYTGESFTKDENVMAEEGSIAPMSTASADSASSVQWLDISRSEVESSAVAMMSLPWTIKRGNLTPRNTETVELPAYLRDCSVGEAQIGIPYCKGGYNGVGGTNEFETVVATGVDSQGCPTAGNVADVGGNQLCTVGLDCARFLCKAFEFTNGLSPGQFITQYVDAGYGHVVEADIQLLKWDVIVSGSHAMFYADIDTDGTVIVYDVTSGVFDAKTDERDTSCTKAQLASKGYQFVHMYSSFGWNTTSHFTACATCGGYRAYTNHNYMWTQYSSTQHKKACQGCDYYIYEDHSWSPGGSNIICSMCSYVYTGEGVPAGYVDDEPIGTDEFAFVDVERRESVVASKGSRTC